MRSAARDMTSVKLSKRDVALLPAAPTIAEAVRMAIVIAAERKPVTAAHDADPDATMRRLAALAQRGGDVLAGLDALETGPRVVRIETFLLLIADGLARFLEQYGALHATVDRLDGAFSQATDQCDAGAEARWRATRDRVLEQLFDPFDIAIQTMAQDIATPGAATRLVAEQGARRLPPKLREAAE